MQKITVHLCFLYPFIDGLDRGLFLLDDSLSDAHNSLDDADDVSYYMYICVYPYIKCKYIYYYSLVFHPHLLYCTFLVL